MSSLVTLSVVSLEVGEVHAEVLGGIKADTKSSHFTKHFAVVGNAQFKQTFG